MWMSACFLLFDDSVISALFYCLCSSFRYQLTICGSISRLSSLFMDLFVCLFVCFCQYHTSWLLKLFSRSLRSWNWLYQSSGFVPLLQFELANLDFLPIHINLVSLLISTEWFARSSIQTVDSKRLSGKNWYLDRIKSSYPWTWNISSFI